MLVCFKNNEADGKAHIIKFEDRIWISVQGRADIMRRFWIAVESDSCKLAIIRCLVPCKPDAIYDTQDLTEFSDDPDWVFNAPQRFSNTPTQIVKGRLSNEIDGIKYCRPRAVSMTSTQVGEGTALDINFYDTPLSPGSVYLIAFKFSLMNFIDVNPLRTFGQTRFELPYFSLSGIPQISSCLQQEPNSIIPIVPLLPIDKGGFAIFLYAPPGYELSSTPNPLSEPDIKVNYEGKELQKPVHGNLWELSILMEQRGIDPLTERVVFDSDRFSFPFHIRGRVHKSIVESIEGTRNLTWLSIGLACLAIIITIVIAIVALAVQNGS